MTDRPHASILDTIGRTPIVRLDRLAPEGVDLFAKCEAFNPLGSVKDRMALEVIEAAERSGQLRPGQTVVEATSGNTGIGLAMVCARKGYPLVVVMAENFSVERRKLMRFLGARVVLTPAPERGVGMVAKAEELAAEHGWYLCRQFDNEANARAHERTTGPEIVAAFEGRRLDYWVSGFGTGGTLKGVARVLRRRRPDVRIVACEPDNSPMMSSGTPQPRRPDGSPDGSHPHFRTHLVQGWAPDFIPQLAEDARSEGLIDDVVAIDSAEAVRLARELATREGILTGISGGATLAGALAVAAGAEAGAAIVCMLPDTGERYLSTPLFDGIAEDMTEEERELSRSTPGYRFDRAAAPTSGSALLGRRQPSPRAEAFLRDRLDDADGSVLVFALQHCEFCWSVRKLFDACGIDHETISLDAPEFQAHDWGGQIRAALGSRTDSATLPQVFIGPEYVGGCTEVLDEYASGRLFARLDRQRLAFHDPGAPADRYLPSWLHPR